jgi:hypothetical protein
MESSLPTKSEKNIYILLNFNKAFLFSEKEIVMEKISFDDFWG